MLITIFKGHHNGEQAEGETATWHGFELMVLCAIQYVPAKDTTVSLADGQTRQPLREVEVSVPSTMTHG